MAATANGLFVGGTYAGGGIAAPTQSALNTQFGAPHTGMIYTPPTYSDHIAVSLLMKNEFGTSIGQLILDEKDSATKKSQPHKKQRSIASFFAPNAVAVAKKMSSETVGSSQDKKRSSTSSNDSAPNKKIISSFFGSTNTTKSAQSKSTKMSTKSTKGKTAPPKGSLLNHFKK